MPKINALPHPRAEEKEHEFKKRFENSEAAKEAYPRLSRRKFIAKLRWEDHVR